MFSHFVTMTKQELKEVFDLLERSGMDPQLCDTPVPCYENEVPAGIFRVTRA